MLNDGAPGAVQVVEAEAEGLCPHPSSGTGNSCCGVGKPCRQHNSGLGSAPWCEAGATHGLC